MGQPNSGVIVKLILYPAKGEGGRGARSAALKEGLGMEGDFHATGGDRQLSLLSCEARRWMEEQAEAGLCFARFRENISFEGLGPLAPGTRLAAGGAVLEITGQAKSCHAECGLFREGRPCRLSGQNLFAKVIKSGIIEAGMKIEAGA